MVARIPGSVTARAKGSPGIWAAVGDPPGSARWPRIMTGRHPDAVGTFGPSMIEWAEARKLHTKRTDGSRWWQRLAAARALEHNRAGELVWRTVIISTPRQQGKSWLERELCAWRIEQGALFGEEQNVLHVAHKLTAAEEVWRPAARYYDHLGRDEARVRYANGEQQIELADGSRWLIQAANEGVGVAFSIGMALVDEGWRVKRSVYDNGIEPTLAEAESPQTYLVSTAGDVTSDLMTHYRAEAVAEIDAPGNTLIIEYSAPADAELSEPLDVDDRGVWRAACAHWDARREAWMTDKRKKAGERSFRQHALNQWQPTLTPPVLPAGTWERVATTRAPGGTVGFGVDIDEDHERGVIVAVGSGVAEVVDDRPEAGWIVRRVVELLGRNGGAVALDGAGPARALLDPLRRVLGREQVLGLTGADMAARSGATLDDLTGDRPAIALRDDERMMGAITSARKRKTGAAWVWDRDGEGLFMVALSCAQWAEAHAPAPPVEDDEPMVYA
jgi:hypothetical protein